VKPIFEHVVSAPVCYFVDAVAFNGYSEHRDMHRYNVAQDWLYKNLMQFTALSKNKREMLRKFLRPYNIPSILGGTAGGKIAEILEVMHFTPDDRRMLDFGTHPGSAIRACFSKFKQLKFLGVSKFPVIDNDKGFCYKLPVSDRITVLQEDVNDFEPEGEKFSVIFDDAYDIADPKNVAEMVKDYRIHFSEVNRRAQKFQSICSYYVMKIRGFDEELITQLYGTYLQYGDFNIIKPVYTYPWNVEFYVIFQNRQQERRIRKHQFQRRMYKFLNDNSVRMMIWSDYLLDNVNSILSGNHIQRNILQQDESIQHTIFSTIGLNDAGTAWSA